MSEPELEYQVCDNFGRTVTTGFADKKDALAKCQQLQINTPHGGLVPRQYFVTRGPKQREINLNSFFEKGD